MTFTKEQLIAQAQKNIKVLRDAVEKIPGGSDAAVIHLRLAEIALAALESKPVEVTFAMAMNFHHALNDGGIGNDDIEEIMIGLRAAFANVTAPPAPVSVPDEKKSRELFEKWCSVSTERNKWHPEHYAHLPAREQWNAWEACRADLLQGKAEPVSQRDELGWVACSERMPHIGVPVITCCGDVVQYAVYAWDGKEWQDWYEEYDKLPSDTFTHWHPRPVAPQQEDE